MFLRLFASDWSDLLDSWNIRPHVSEVLPMFMALQSVVGNLKIISSKFDIFFLKFVGLALYILALYGTVKRRPYVIMAGLIFSVS